MHASTESERIRVQHGLVLAHELVCIPEISGARVPTGGSVEPCHMRSGRHRLRRESRYTVWSIY
jgi:hypothetical protein